MLQNLPLYQKEKIKFEFTTFWFTSKHIAGKINGLWHVLMHGVYKIVEKFILYPFECVIELTEQEVFIQ